MAEIIGVAGDVKHRALDEALSPTIYTSAFQSPSNSDILVVRSSRPDADVIGAVREEVARLDRDLPVYGVGSLANVIAVSPGVPARRVLTAAFFGFALMAVVISALGLFGVAAHDAARRRAEFAIRIALGADRRRILTASLRHGATIVGAGLVAGAVLSIWATRALGAILFATGQLDFVAASLPAAVVIVAAAAALLPPALRAARTDAVLALRAE
jgi:ABC-type antimicrobial peptide transport system permease subunit